MRKDWVIKSVSIEQTDAEIIQRQGPAFNLSAFVRQCLRRYALHKDQLSTSHPQPGVRERLGFCMPRSMCVVCWPDGPPSQEAWDNYRGSARNFALHQLDGPIIRKKKDGPGVGDKDLLLSTITSKFNMDDMKVEGNSPASRKKSNSFIGKVLNFLRL
ncbi:unnamed protein product [marine sediment metagenome]|uniref:Uncharacterized protein n=1 Tax=marine sediment metagenome TaxID=412755 RepID=X1S2Z6_9ZZZZ